MSILLVEDNPGDVMLVREALESHGVTGELVVLSDGEKAIRFIRDMNERPGEHDGDCLDLLILDLSLPKRSGLDVLREMRLNPSCENVPVFVLSSSDTPRDKAESENLGAIGYIRKPSRLEDFLSLGAVFRDAIAGRKR